MAAAKLFNIDLSRKAPGSTMGTQYPTGIPGFDELSKSASTNVQDLLAGAESPDITRNINAAWGAGAGVPGSEFLNNRGADLYGQRAAARKQQGLGDLLALLQGYSGTVVARPDTLIGERLADSDRTSREGMARAELANRRYEFGRTFPESQRQFNAQFGLNAFNAGNNAFSSYMDWL